MAAGNDRQKTVTKFNGLPTKVGSGHIERLLFTGVDGIF